LDVSPTWLCGNDTFYILSRLPLKALYEIVVCILIFENGLTMCVGGNQDKQYYFTVEPSSAYAYVLGDNILPDNVLMYEDGKNFKAFFVKKKVQMITNKFKNDGVESGNKKQKI